MELTERESMVQELHTRLSTVTGVVRCARNPEGPPGEDECPAINLFERNDVITGHRVTKRNDFVYPVHERRLYLALEFFVKGSTEGAASPELIEFAALARKAIFQTGISLLGRGKMKEADSVNIVSVPGGSHLKATGFGLTIEYVESVARLFE